MARFQCDDHFVRYISNEELGCTPEINKMLYINYILIIQNKVILNNPLT